MATPIADGLDDPADDRRVCRFPGPCPVEVDDVQPARACIREGPRHRDRIVRERGLPLEIALHQSNDATRPQVDRRQDLEATCHRSLTVLAF